MLFWGIVSPTLLSNIEIRKFLMFNFSSLPIIFHLNLMVSSKIPKTRILVYKFVELVRITSQ